MLADCLALQSVEPELISAGSPEAVSCGRRALAMARELGYPLGQWLATAVLIIAALSAADPEDAVRLAGQAGQIPDMPGIAARARGYLLAVALAETGDLAAAEQAGAAALARDRDAGDLHSLQELLPVMADLDLRAGRTGDAAAHLREAAQTALRTGTWSTMLNVLDGCGHLCAATGRPADAITAWAAEETLERQGGFASEDAYARRREEARHRVRQALGPDRARAAEDRGAAMSLATAAEYALMLTAPGPQQPPAAGGGEAERPGAGAGHAGRPGPHRRRHRRTAVHQHPHRPLAPGPDPGQDRLPPPRRPDPPGPDRRPGLAGPPRRACG